ncbi:MAG: hypothetical protein L3J67_07215 [Hyphomicrobiaceae bacterium]|nr:hypothetical protein [Hyphomicrobiaceae bacterium]
MLILVSFRQNSAAAVWVEQISGNPAAILIVRQGNFIKAEEVMRLQPGDIIKIQDDTSAIRLMMGNGGLKTINKAHSPFTLAGGQAKGSFLANLMGEVKKMLVASSDQTEAVAMMTRGRSKQLRLLAANPEDNLVLEGTRQIGVGWTGGKAPYRLSLLEAEEDQPLWGHEGLPGNSFTITADKTTQQGLAAGEYLLLLESTGSKTSDSKELELLVVGMDELPEKARKLLTLKLDKRLEARLLINILVTYENWRFYAHSLAIAHKLKQERRLLVSLK